MTFTIITGGQTGVDRAALDAALLLDIPYKGWCPKGRIDENGNIPKQYDCLSEVVGEFKTEKENYDARTKLNITDSDGTLILVPSLPLPESIKDGTLLTIDEVKKQNKSSLVINLSDELNFNTQCIYSWATENSIKNLNIAGPRESSHPGIYDLSLNLLKEVCLNLKKQFSTRLKL